MGLSYFCSGLWSVGPDVVHANSSIVAPGGSSGQRIDLKLGCFCWESPDSAPASRTAQRTKTRRMADVSAEELGVDEAEVLGCSSGPRTFRRRGRGFSNLQ